jgi:16S rRNA (uracil1498-N3)-methyltransferase
MADRYFVENPIGDEKTSLAGPEAHHLIHVLRAKPGDRVTLFDGSGAEFNAEITTVSRNNVDFDILGREEIDRELAFELTIGVALPKGDRQRWLVEKAVELGVARIVPLRTSRSVAQPVEKALGRLRRTVIEASKQCGRNRLMVIDSPQDWHDFVGTEMHTEAQASCRLLAHPGSGATTPRIDPTGNVLLAIGPEGGFSEDEATLALNAGWQAINLGRRILRTETAAILLTAMVSRG